MSFIRSALLSVSLLAAFAAQAAGVSNGSLTGRIDNDGVPTGWTALAGSPDVMDGGNNVGVSGLQRFGALPDASPDGGTWVGLGSSRVATEAFGQLISGLTVGETYMLTWFDGNFGYSEGSTQYLDDNQIKAYDSSTGMLLGLGQVRNLGSDWQMQSLSFTAQSSVMNLAFTLSDTAARSYLSIDGIRLSSVTAVPESSTLMLSLLGLAGVALAVRRRAA